MATFDEMPVLLAEVNRKLDILLQERNQEPEPDRKFTVPEFQDYIQLKTGKRPKKQTVFDWTCKRKVPFEKFGKYLYFQKSTIDTWLQNGRQL